MKAEVYVKIEEHIAYLKNVVELTGDTSVCENIFKEIEEKFDVQTDSFIAGVVLGSFGYKAIDWLPYEIKSNPTVIKSLARVKDAQDFVVKKEDMTILKSPTDKKPVVLYDNLVCVEAGPYKVQSILDDYKFFEFLPTSEFRINEHGNCVSNELIKVLLCKLRKDVSLCDDKLDKNFTKQTSEIINRCIAKTEAAEKELAEQDYLYHIGSGYVENMKTYKKQGEKTMAYVEPMTIPVEGGKLQDEYTFHESEEFVEAPVQFYIDYASSPEIAKEVGGESNQAIKKVYQDLDNVVKEYENMLKGKMMTCTLTNDYVESLKKAMAAVYRSVEEKVKALEEFFKNKDEVLDMIEDAESRLIR